MKNEQYLAVGLGNVAGMAQTQIGALEEAERNAQLGISLDQKIQDFSWEAENHRWLSVTHCYCGKWVEAEQEFISALALYEKEKHIQMLGNTNSDRALLFLLMGRANPQSKIVNLKSSIECSVRALELADEDTRIRYPHPRDYIRNYWILGAAYRASGDLTKADDNLSKAINLCRQINLIDHEAYILLELARLRYEQKGYEEAKSLADEALTITERCGYVLQGADVNLFLAQYALEQEQDKVKAKEYAESALKLATCDGPPYYYKVAYEEAERFLENLK